MATMIAAHPASVASARIGSRQKKLPHLQALRGLAASLVVFSHCIDTLMRHGFVSPMYAERLGISGYFGVAIFFVISGFIIYKTSSTSFGHPKAVAIFLARRLIRIFPIYWIATATFIALSPHYSELAARHIVASLFLFPHFDPHAGNLHPIVGQGWTLQYEILFYGLFALGLLFRRRAGTFLTVASLVVLVFAGQLIMPLSSSAEPLTVASYWTRPIMLLFVVGIGFGLLEERFHSTNIPHPFPCMLMGLAIWFIYTLSQPLTAEQQIQFPTVIAIWILSAAMVFVSIYGQRASGTEGRLERFAEHFGDASYSVYLFHTLVISALVRLKLETASPVLFVVASLCVANLFGFALYRFVEKPILTRFRRMLPREA